MTDVRYITVPDATMGPVATGSGAMRNRPIPCTLVLAVDDELLAALARPAAERRAS